MLDQETRRDHPHAIVHPPGRPQLPHPGIDDRVAGPPLRPRLELRAYRRRPDVAPRDRIQLLARILRAIIGELQDHILRIVAPADLAQEHIDRSAHIGDAAPDSGRRHLAEMQMRAQPRTALDRRQVARAAILRRLVDKGIDPLARARLARLPPGKTRRPVGLGRQQSPILQPVRFGPVRRLGNRARLVHRSSGRHPPLQRAPERGEDLVRLT